VSFRLAASKEVEVIELRPVGVDAFEDVYPLLVGFRNRRTSKEDWRRMLFTYPWTDEPRRGYAVYSDGKAIGFLGTILSKRTWGGRVERVCNLSTWIVDRGYPNASILLTRPVLAEMDGYTIVGFTPSPMSCAVFARLGFRTFETEQMLLLPLPHPIEALRSLAGSIAISRDVLDQELRDEELAIHRDHAGSRAVGVLLRRKDTQCYLVARTDRRKHLPVAELLYIGDREFFWQNRFLAHAVLFYALGAVGLVVDRRFAEGRRGPHALRLERTRIFRPSRPDITPMAIDGLYSELVMLRE
jgi:hypothetical protein